MNKKLQLILDQLYQDKLSELTHKARSVLRTKTIYVYYDQNKLQSDCVFLEAKIKICNIFNVPLVIKDLNSYCYDELIKQFNDIQNNNDFLYFEYPLSSQYKELNLNQYLDNNIDIDGALANILYQTKINYLPIAGSIIVDLLSRINFDKKLKFVVIGKSVSYGYYIYQYLINNNYNADLFDTKTFDLSNKIKNYDVVISTINQPLVFSCYDLRDNSYLIDGTTAHHNNFLVGSFRLKTDLHKRNIDYITTPNGVGKLSSIYLLLNYFKYL